jgi:hypothetical protein
LGVSDTSQTAAAASCKDHQIPGRMTGAGSCNGPGLRSGLRGNVALASRGRIPELLAPMAASGTRCSDTD